VTRQSGEHDREHDHEHGHVLGLMGRLRRLVVPHSHDTADKVDTALETNDQGIRALKISLAGLAVTAIVQSVVVAYSG
jgi:hypothetical protein